MHILFAMLNAAILNPKDDEELAMTLNGRKNKIKASDFETAALSLGITSKVVRRIINKYIKLLPKFENAIRNSFLSAALKEDYIALLTKRTEILKSGLKEVDGVAK